MSFDPLSAALSLGKTVIEKIWPDPTKRAQELLKLEELHQKGDIAELNAHVQLMLGQLEVNKVEAAHSSIFVAGWRPFVGWVGGFSLAYAGIIHPLLGWVFLTLQGLGYIPETLTTPPFVESGLLGTIVAGMLGIGGMRSYDKKSNNQTDRIK